MRITKDIGVLLLAAYLVVKGLSEVIELEFAGMEAVLAVMAIAAGVMFVFGIGKLPTGLSRIVFGIYLLLIGLLALFPVEFPQQELVMGILAVVAGLLLLFRRERSVSA